ncbi:hypothetical protein L9F63_027895, partial [Diploptera punctata]
SGPGTPGMPGSNGQQRTKRMRTSFKHHQLRTMKSYFAINHNPDAKDLKQLSQKTGLPKRVLQACGRTEHCRVGEGKLVDKNIQRIVTIIFSKLSVVAGSTSNSSSSLTAPYNTDRSNTAKEARTKLYLYKSVKNLTSFLVIYPIQRTHVLYISHAMEKNARDYHQGLPRSATLQTVSNCNTQVPPHDGV